MHKGIPKTSAMNSEEESLEDVPISGSDMRISVRGTREIYIGTPERRRRQKRRGDPDDMEDDDSKTRRFNSETEERESMSPDDRLSTSPMGGTSDPKDIETQP